MSALDFLAGYTDAVEEEMRATLAAARAAGVRPLDSRAASPEPPAEALYRMAEYHLGWRDDRGQPTALSERARLGGKRLRPVLCLLSCEAVSGSPAAALSAAAGIEFIHNFSLIHDDIEDGDEARRHRPTVWKLWGIPQAINAGSHMQALVYAAASRAADAGLPHEDVCWVLSRLTVAILRMTEGQHLDMSFERLEALDVDQYWTMVRGKTAALIAAATAIGAHLGSASSRSERQTANHQDTKTPRETAAGGAAEQQLGLQGPNDPITQRPNHPTTQPPNDPTTLFARFGELFGLAFQARDDYLGIWGLPEVTGKPVGADILRKKKSLPVAFALSQAKGSGGELRDYYAAPGPEPEKVASVLETLERLGARDYVQAQVRRLTDQAFEALEAVRLPETEGPRALAFRRIAVITRYALDREF